MQCIEKECSYRELNGGDDIGDFYFCSNVEFPLNEVSVNAWMINSNQK